MRKSYFYPRPPRGGRHVLQGDSHAQILFLSTPSSRRATTGLPSLCRRMSNFYPRPPRGGRQHNCQKNPEGVHFYPRPPRGGRRCGASAKKEKQNISIHALLAEGDLRPNVLKWSCRISIHALLAEGDRQLESTRLAALRISIHALLAEGDAPDRWNMAAT